MLTKFLTPVSQTSIFTFLLLTCYLTSFSQLPKGLIADPATGTGRIVLDPNLDGWISATGAAFISQDSSESEIIYKKMVIISEPNSDLGAGPNCGYTDYVYSTTAGMTMAGGYYLDANNNWLIRVRLSRFLPNSKSYSVLIDTDLKMGPSGVNKDPGYVIGNPGFEIELLLSTANPGGMYIYDVNNTITPTQKTLYVGHTNYQRSVAMSNECGDEDAFLDFFIPFSALTTHFGITTSTPLRWVLTDNMSADQSTIGHLSNISDLWGSSKFNEAGILEVIENFTPTCASCTPGKLRSVCPSVNSPIAAGATSVSGTGTNGDTIKLYKKNTASRIPNSTTYAIVSGGTWTITGLTGIVSGDTIGASATTPGKGESIYNCDLTAVTTCGTVATLVSGLVSGNPKGACGSAGAGIDNAGIGVYISGTRIYPDNLLQNDTITVITDGSFTWKANVNNTNCNSGAGSASLSGSGMVTQTVNGCESSGVCVKFSSGGGGAVTTTAPAITTNPIINGTTPIAGTCVSGTTVFLYADGVQIGTQTPAGTSWSITPSPALTTGQVITAKAQSAAECISAASSSRTVSRQTVAPVITGSYCGTPITTVSGTSVEASGTKIYIYANGVFVDSTATVSSTGTWTKSGLSFSTGPITAYAKITGGTLSSVSNSVAVGTKTTDGSLSITTTPITDALTSISGNGTTSNTIKLYVDDVQIGSTTVSGGTWTISGLTAGSDLFQGGYLKATSTSTGNCESNATTPVAISCVAPSDLGATSSVSTCQGSVATGVLINNSQAGTVYQLYNGSSPFGTATLGTGGTISLTTGTVTSTMTLTLKAIKSSSCATTFASSVSVTIDPPDSTWYGRVSTDWFDARNWCLSGNIPTATTKTKISGSATYMPIIASAGAVCDTMIINSGATVTTSGSQNLDVYGGWTNNGTFTANSGTVSFKDANGQVIKGSSVTTFNNLIINNTSVAGITLNQDVTVTGAMTLTDGIVYTSSTNLLSLTSIASSTSGSSASFVDGPMEKSGTTAFLFPVGDGSTYAPIAIGTPTSSSTFQAQYFASGYTNTTSMAGSPSPVLANTSGIEYWQLDRISGGDATVALYWDNAGNHYIDDCPNLRIARYNGSAWENNNDASTTTSSGCPNPTTEGGNIATNSTVSSFGAFTFGSVSGSLNPLPVKLTSFKGVCSNRDVKIKWVTVSETNNDYFTVEKGTHPSKVVPIGKVIGAGNSNQLANYEFEDTDALKRKQPDEILYYRLKQTDFNGEFEYTNFIIVTDCDDANLGVTVYPNPSDGHLQVVNNNRAATNIEIYNLMGAKVYSSALTNAYCDILVDLPEGIYYYLFTNKDEQVSKGKLLIK